MAKQFKVGDKVKIRESSQYHGKHPTMNPAGVVGTITETSRSISFPIRVQWPGEEVFNGYGVDDLKLVKVKAPKAGEEKHYEDSEGDNLEVDTVSSKEYVYFTTSEGSTGDGQIVRLRTEDAKKIRKQLGHWLDNQKPSV